MSDARMRVSRHEVLVLQGRLTERDRRILEHVGALRLLGARQIQSLLFPAEQHANAQTAARCCRRVLERLTRERLLVRLERRVGGSRAGSASFIYGLGTVGQRVLDDDRPRRRLSEPSARFVDHTLAISDFLVRLHEQAAAGRWELLEWQSEPRCWRSVQLLVGRVVLRPDLFVALGVGDLELRWFIEIDRGSEHLPALQRKYRLYHSYYRSGAEQRRRQVFPRVLWIMPDERRASRLAEAIRAERRLTPGLFHIAVDGEALDAIGATAGEPS